MQMPEDAQDNGRIVWLPQKSESYERQAQVICKSGFKIYDWRSATLSSPHVTVMMMAMEKISNSLNPLVEWMTESKSLWNKKK